MEQNLHYIYYRDGDYIIIQIPSKYKKEFQENSSWLRIGFHTIEPTFDENIQIHDFISSYDSVYAAIEYFAGKQSQTHNLRLHNLYCNPDIITMLVSRYILGLICADSKKRTSYDLNTKENKILHADNFIIKDSVKYFTTDIRIEDFLFPTYKLQTLQDRDTLGLFTHEWAQKNKDKIYK